MTEEWKESDTATPVVDYYDEVPIVDLEDTMS
jgi:hypothetical protein